MVLILGFVVRWIVPLKKEYGQTSEKVEFKSIDKVLRVNVVWSSNVL